ncbi:NmrA family NAD(P)-binding protein [Streptomyces sp. NPDC050546]|uniref:NmrA family NAD(P)-binding protein n=1 Tax=Streptomyces sp. NPDC050546 TaxID=3365628 RepID=UPI003797B54A
MSTPPTTRPLTLVIGGTGTTGRRVVQRLTAAGHPVRVGSRSGAPAFDWEDTSTWQAVLDGVDRVYIAHPDMTQRSAAGQIEALSRAAVTAGVQRLVLLSGRGGLGVQAVEDGVRNSGAQWTIARAGWFNQNFSEVFLLDAVLAGEIAMPEFITAEDFIDADDIADVAVAALTEDRHAGKTYELSGPRLLSFAEAAAEISRATGRTITYTPLTAEQARTALPGDGMTEDMAEEFIASLRENTARLAHGVEEALGRKPKDFSEYVRETAATGVWNA